MEKSSALFHYASTGLVRDLVWQLKYQGRESIGSWLGKWFGSNMADEGMSGRIDWVIPVPLHPKKLRRRGYNQCRNFGVEIAGCIGAAYSEDFLCRQRHSRTQTHSGRLERIDSIHGAFSVRNGTFLDGSRILLVDDVITTGATLEACCDALAPIQGIELYIGAMAAVP